MARQKKLKLPKKSHQETVSDVYNLLMKENTGWMKICKEYADGILTKKDRYIVSGQRVKRRLNRIAKITELPLSLYSRVTFAKDSKDTCEFDIRLYGHSISSASVSWAGGNKPSISFEANEQFAKKHLIEDVKKGYKYSAAEGLELFRKYVVISKDNLNKTESIMENAILEEFAKTKSDKALPFVQPVRFGKYGFVQVPTPLAASNHEVKYATQGDTQLAGGGIDILARANHGSSRDSHFVVIELKDDTNSYSEPQPLVMQQALMYATFLACLFRSSEANGLKWYNIFRSEKRSSDLTEVPKTLEIDVVTLMPPIDYEDDIKEWLGVERIKVEGLGETYLNLYTCYVDKDENGSIKFSGSFPDSLQKVKSQEHTH